MIKPGMNDDHVSLAADVTTSVPPTYFDISVFSEVGPCAADESPFAIKGKDQTLRTDQLGQHRRVVSAPTTDLHDAFLLLDVENVEEVSPQTGKSGIQLAAFVNRHQHVSIQVDRIRIRGRSVAKSGCTPD